MSMVIQSFDNLHDNRVLRYCADFEGNLTSKWGISKARFYVSASNLFIITGYSGYDPEVDIQTGLTCGMDYNRYPRSRSFVLGTNITF